MLITDVREVVIPMQPAQGQPVINPHDAAAAHRLQELAESFAAAMNQRSSGDAHQTPTEVARVLKQIGYLANQLSERELVDADPAIVAALRELSQSYGFARLMRIVRDTRQAEGGG